MPGAWDWLAKRRRWSLALGLTCCWAVLALLEAASSHRDTARRRRDRQSLHLVLAAGVPRLRPAAPELRQPPARWARDASYPVYILHQTVIIVIAYFVIQQPWRPWTKYWVVLGATLLTCVLLYEFLLRRFARAARRVRHQDARKCRSRLELRIHRKWAVSPCGNRPSARSNPPTFSPADNCHAVRWRLHGVAMGTGQSCLLVTSADARAGTGTREPACARDT